jgi:hypothetical protein
MNGSIAVYTYKMVLQKIHISIHLVPTNRASTVRFQMHVCKKPKEWTTTWHQT